MDDINRQKEAARIRSRMWYQNNKSKAKNSTMEWRKAHPEQTKAIARKSTAKWVKNNSSKGDTSLVEWLISRREHVS